MYIFISYSNNYYGNYEILVFLSDMSEMQCFKRQSINIQVTFDIIIEIQNKSRKEYNIDDYVINISPSINCSIYQQTIKCNELNKETEYEIKIIKFNYSNNSIIVDRLFINPQGICSVYLKLNSHITILQLIHFFFIHTYPYVLHLHIFAFCILIRFEQSYYKD